MTEIPEITTRPEGYDSLLTVIGRAMGIASVWPETTVNVSLQARSHSTDVHAPVAFVIQFRVERFVVGLERVFSYRFSWPLAQTFAIGFEDEVTFIVEQAVKEIEGEVDRYVQAQQARAESSVRDGRDVVRRDRAPRDGRRG